MSNFQKGMLAGAGVLFVAALIIGALIAQFGFYDVSADQPDSGLTSAIIAYVREQSVEARVGAIRVPPLNDPKMIAEGAEHYDAMCTACHLAPGTRENEMRPGMNPKPPILWKQPPGDPAEQFQIIKHGVRMTGMPAWGISHSDEEIWNMVALLHVLPKLSPAMYHALVASAGKHHERDMPMDMGH